jgi:aminoglycoside phosphotransferase (APT) family kinase protein
MGSVLGGAPLRRGSSGARIRLGDTVVKQGGPETKVPQQGRWLAENVGYHLPEVYAVGDDWYEMERLTPLTYNETTFAPALARRAIDALKFSVWSRPAKVQMDVQAHADKVAGIATDSQYERLQRAYSKIEWDRLPTCLTHGDPTFDNLMWGKDGSIVLIDPIPATPAVPDIRAVDLGKMLTSVYGFETMRYGYEKMTQQNDTVSVIEYVAGRNEQLAAQYWCAIHFLRAAPYMPTDDIRKEMSDAADRILGALLRRV